MAGEVDPPNRSLQALVSEEFAAVGEALVAAHARTLAALAAARPPQGCTTGESSTNPQGFYSSDDNEDQAQSYPSESYPSEFVGLKPPSPLAGAFDTILSTLSSQAQDHSPSRHSTGQSSRTSRKDSDPSDHYPSENVGSKPSSPATSSLSPVDSARKKSQEAGGAVTVTFDESGTRLAVQSVCIPATPPGEPQHDSDAAQRVSLGPVLSVSSCGSEGGKKTATFAADPPDSSAAHGKLDTSTATGGSGVSSDVVARSTRSSASSSASKQTDGTSSLPNSSLRQSLSDHLSLSRQSMSSQMSTSISGAAAASPRASTCADKGSRASTNSQTSLSSHASFIPQPSQEYSTMNSLAEVETFQLHEFWSSRKKADTTSVHTGRAQVSTGSRPSVFFQNSDLCWDGDAEEDEDELDETHLAIKRHEHGRSPYMIHPEAVKRTVWDLTSLVLVSFDMFFLPLGMFDLPDTTFTESAAWASRVFWTLDIIASFVTGTIKKDGLIEMNFRRIAARYSVTWLPLDLFIVLSDWLDLILSTGGTESGYARLGKITRVFRMVRLLRLLKMQNQIAHLLERFHSEYILIFVGISKILFLLLAFAHMIACLWYGIGRGSDGWVAEYQLDAESIALRYSVAMHWSVSQFTGGMDEFVPQNLNERLFSLVVFMLAFLLSCLFVSSITSSMTQLNILSSSESLQLSHLRRYMFQNAIPKQLSVRVQRSAEQSLQVQHKFIPEREVSALRHVTRPLLVEVHFSLYSHLLHIHSFFDRYIKECSYVMKQVCHLAMAVQHNVAGDIFFQPGEKPEEPKMYVVCSGRLQYISIMAKRLEARSGSVVSEANLWVNWTHQGEFKAVSDCRMCTIDAIKFRAITGTFDHPDFDPAFYAAAFVKDLNKQAADNMTAPLDIAPMLDIDAVLSTRPNRLRGKSSAALGEDVESKGDHDHHEGFFHKAAARATQMTHWGSTEGKSGRRTAVVPNSGNPKVTTFGNWHSP